MGMPSLQMQVQQCRPTLQERRRPPGVGRFINGGMVMGGRIVVMVRVAVVMIRRKRYLCLSVLMVVLMGMWPSAVHCG